MGLDIWFEKRKTITKELDYFRKVNFLVKYFEGRGADIDSQIPFPMTKDDAEELLNRCEEVLKDHSKAEELLPTMEGFFFGPTDYDEYYFDDVERVRNSLITKVIPAFDTLENDENIYFTIWW